MSSLLCLLYTQRSQVITVTAQCDIQVGLTDSAFIVELTHTDPGGSTLYTASRKFVSTSGQQQRAVKTRLAYHLMHLIKQNSCLPTHPADAEQHVSTHEYKPSDFSL